MVVVTRRRGLEVSRLMSEEEEQEEEDWAVRCQREKYDG